MTIEFKFSMLQVVNIKANGSTGTVIGLFADRDGLKFAHLQYADKSGQVHEKYFREDELTSQ